MTTLPSTDLTLTLTPGDQIVFRRALKLYHQERRAAFIQPDPEDIQTYALVLGLVESCRAKLGDDTWSVD